MFQFQFWFLMKKNFFSWLSSADGVKWSLQDCYGLYFFKKLCGACLAIYINLSEEQSLNPFRQCMKTCMKTNFLGVKGPPAESLSDWPPSFWDKWTASVNGPMRPTWEVIRFAASGWSLIHSAFVMKHKYFYVTSTCSLHPMWEKKKQKSPWK